MSSQVNGNGSMPSRGSSSSSFSDHATNGLLTRTTEGWLELFLTTPEKFAFSHWKEKVNDKSLTHRLMHPLMEKLAPLVPDTVAPNVLALFGPVALGQAWYLTNEYGTTYPTTCTWLAVVFILLYFVTNSLTNYHADRTRQRTALGELFKYSCDAAATVFLSILLTYCLGGTSIETQWHAVQIAQLVLFLKHLSAFDRHAGLRFNVLTGPGEVLLISVTLLAIRGTFGLEWLLDIYERSVHNALVKITPLLVDSQHVDVDVVKLDKYKEDPSQLGSEAVRLTYYTVYLIAVTRSLLLKDPHGWSRFGLSASLLMRVIPALLFTVGLQQTVSVADVICDGLFLAVLTSDVTLAKMAGRELHPWVVLMSMAAVLSHPIILTLCTVYYIAVFADLCSYLNMPLLTTCRNVYCDGVYDLCHIGHKLLFQNALQYGNRLFVGVVGDEDARAYKRPPIMTAAERCAEVEACKAVTKVIPNSPCFGLTKEFLDEHQIHVVAYGQEYMERYPDPNDDPYYKVPRIMGIARPLPRTEGLSTSDLIRRIQKSRPADDKLSPT